MTNERELEPAGLSIAAVERDSGLPKETLRAWERRYGFPTPQRDRHGERLYSPEQVATLRLLRHLVDAGHRPGRVVGRPAADIAALVKALAPGRGETAELQSVLALLRENRADALRAHLSGVLLSRGLGSFARECVPDLTDAVGAAWLRGELEIHQEHLFTEQITDILRGAIGTTLALTPAQARPVILLTTLPGEPHALGLLMAEVMFVLAGCRCIGLGPQTPIPAIAGAARAHGVDVIALSFSAHFSAADAESGLSMLQLSIRGPIEIWAGGACRGLRPREGVQIVRDLAAVADNVAAWRARRLGN